MPGQAPESRGVIRTQRMGRVGPALRSGPFEVFRLAELAPRTVAQRRPSEPCRSAAEDANPTRGFFRGGKLAESEPTARLAKTRHARATFGSMSFVRVDLGGPLDTGPIFELKDSSAPGAPLGLVDDDEESAGSERGRERASARPMGWGPTA